MEVAEAAEPLSRSFYDRDKHTVARDLLGHRLVREIDDHRLAGRIVETEVYGGPDDRASHADSGEPTERTRSMFGPPGTIYIYKIYGMYHCLNVVVPAEAKAAAILIRALEPLRGLEAMAKRRGLADRYDESMTRTVKKNLLSGPGKLCQAFALDRALDGTALAGGGLWIASDTSTDPEPSRIESTPRIGLNPDTVGEAADYPWRYILADSPYLSR